MTLILKALPTSGLNVAVVAGTASSPRCSRTFTQVPVGYFDVLGIRLILHLPVTARSKSSIIGSSNVSSSAVQSSAIRWALAIYPMPEVHEVRLPPPQLLLEIYLVRRLFFSRHRRQIDSFYAHFDEGDRQVAEAPVSLMKSCVPAVYFLARTRRHIHYLCICSHSGPVCPDKRRPHGSAEFALKNGHVPVELVDPHSVKVVGCQLVYCLSIVCVGVPLVEVLW